MDDKLNTVYCQVDISLSGNNYLFDRVKLHKKFTKEMTQYLKTYGVKYKVEPLSGLGGGGVGEGLLFLLKTMWDQRGILGVIFTIFRLISNHVFMANFLKLFYKVDHTKPRMKIFLRLKTDDQYGERELNYLNGDLINRILNLQGLSEGLFNLLTTNHPLFLFDQEIRASIYSKSFRVLYSIPHEMQNKFNTFRVRRFIQALRIKDMQDIEYGFPNNLFAVRTESKLIYNNLGSFMKDRTSKTYYFFISSKVIMDYLYVVWYEIKLLKIRSRTKRLLKSFIKRTITK